MNVNLWGRERVHICQLLRSAAHKRELCFMKSCKSVLKNFSLCSFVRVENEMKKASPRVLRHKSMVSKDSGIHWLSSLILALKVCPGCSLR